MKAERLGLSLWGEKLNRALLDTPELWKDAWKCLEVGEKGGVYLLPQKQSGRREEKTTGRAPNDVLVMLGDGEILRGGDGVATNTHSACCSKKPEHQHPTPAGDYCCLKLWKPGE